MILSQEIAETSKTIKTNCFIFALENLGFPEEIITKIASQPVVYRNFSRQDFEQYFDTLGEHSRELADTLVVWDQDKNDPIHMAIYRGNGLFDEVPGINQEPLTGLNINQVLKPYPTGDFSYQYARLKREFKIQFQKELPLVTATTPVPKGQ